MREDGEEHTIKDCFGCIQVTKTEEITWQNSAADFLVTENRNVCQNRLPLSGGHLTALAYVT